MIAFRANHFFIFAGKGEKFCSLMFILIAIWLSEKFKQD